VDLLVLYIEYNRGPVNCTRSKKQEGIAMDYTPVRSYSQVTKQSSWLLLREKRERQQEERAGECADSQASAYREKSH
jgi:hypothetical protein